MAIAVTAGKLLLSSPSMTDANFDRTVIFLLEHTAEGAIGVVINRPTDQLLVDTIPQWAPLAAEPRLVFSGGPVSRGSVIALARCSIEEETTEFAPVLGAVGVLDASRDPADLTVAVDEVRLFSGYSGWSAGQLEAELEAGAWFVIEGAPGDPLTPEPEELWTHALKRVEGLEAMRSQAPSRHWLN